MNDETNSPKSASKRTPTSSAKKVKVPRTGAISKALLTPCRRVGLSARKKILPKKVKPLQSSGEKTRVEAENVVKVVSATVEEKVQKKTAVKQAEKELVKVENVLEMEMEMVEEVERSEKVRLKAKPSSSRASKSKYSKSEKRRTKIEDRFEDVKENVISKEKTEIPKQKKSVPCVEEEVVFVPNLDSVNKNAFTERQLTTDSVNTQQEDSQCTQKSAASSQASKRSYKSLLATKRICSQDTVTEESDEEDHMVLSKFKKLKHSSSITTSKTEESPAIDTAKSCVVELDRMSEEEISQYETPISKKKVRAIIIGSSDEDDDDFAVQRSSQNSKKSASSQEKAKQPASQASSLTTHAQEKVKQPVSHASSSKAHAQENSNESSSRAAHAPLGNVSRSDLQMKIEQLKVDIVAKRVRIQELEQSEVYKKKHDLGEIRELTKRWKSGCQEALKDLLPLVNETTGNNIDMVTLLDQMNIPHDFIGFDSDENGFRN